jgi:CHAT domain-containing protein
VAKKNGKTLSNTIHAWARLGQKRQRAVSLYSAAYLAYWRLYEYKSAASSASEAASLYAGANEPTLSASASVLEGLATIEIANNIEDADAAGVPPAAQDLFDQALAKFQSALTAHEQFGNLYAAGRITDRIGVTYQYMGDLDTALEHYIEAVNIFHGEQEWAEEIRASTNIGTLNFDQGNLINALDIFQRNIEMLPRDRLPSSRAWLLDNLGTTHSYLGNYEDALQAYLQSLPLHRDREDRDSHGEAYTLLGLGRTYLALGELDRAEFYLEDTLELTEETQDSLAREAALRYLGNVAYLRNDFESALIYHEAGLAAATSVRDRTRLRLFMARDLRALQRFTEAGETARQALMLAGEAESDYLRANAELELGHIAVALNKSDIADRRLKAAMQTYRVLELPVHEAEALKALAKAARIRDDVIAARKYGEDAIQAIEALRGNMADPELRAFYMSARRSYYDELIDLLMSARPPGSPEAQSLLHDALAVSERGRARMTVELLDEAAIGLHKNIDPEKNARRRQLMTRLAELRYEQDRLITRAEAGDVADRKLTAVLRELTETEHELNVLDGEIRRASPALASLANPEALTATEIQALLGPDTILLQYSLGRERSHVWVVSAGAIDGFELNAAALIEDAAQQIFELLRTVQTDAESSARIDTLSEELTELILAPIGELPDGRRLLVAADGALNYVPFGALPLPGHRATRLMEHYEIASVPSMSVIAALRKRPEAAGQPRTLLAVGDPVFRADDPRFAAPPDISLLNAPAGMMRSATHRDDLNRLPFTGQEVEAIGSLVPASSRLVLTGFDADRDALLEMDLDRYRYIHIATHGHVDRRYPMLSELAFSRYDRDGRPRNAWLSLSDIYKLRLNADLLVLSACDTGLGREIRGGGLVGLTQGFLYAGARGLVVSLWQVPDRATSELMRRFYDFIFDEGLRPANALRQAQLSIAGERRWSEPYFWAAMVLVGEWQ